MPATTGTGGLETIEFSALAARPRRRHLGGCTNLVHVHSTWCARPSPCLSPAASPMLPHGGVGMADTATGVTITPIHPCLGARVTGVDLAAPLDEVSFRRIFDAFQEHSVLVFHDQRLRDEPQMVFSRRFGPLEETIKATGQENRL